MTLNDLERLISAHMPPFDQQRQFITSIQAVAFISTDTEDRILVLTDNVTFSVSACCLLYYIVVCG